MAITEDELHGVDFFFADCSVVIAKGDETGKDKDGTGFKFTCPIPCLDDPIEATFFVDTCFNCAFFLDDSSSIICSKLFFVVSVFFSSLCWKTTTGVFNEAATKGVATTIVSAIGCGGNGNRKDG